MSEEQKKEASALIATKLKEVDKLLDECAKIADKNEVMFYYNILNESGLYLPEPMWDSSGCEYENTKYEGWISSDANC